MNNLQQRTLNGGQVREGYVQGYQFLMPMISAKKYCLVQLDNYIDLPRRHFPHQPGFRFQVEARVSHQDCVGTWGFGLWNDPFSMGVGMGGVKRVLPVLPNAAWFFYGSPENYLSLRNDQGSTGLHAQIFRSPLLPGILSLLALPTLPLVFVPAVVRLLRRTANILIKEEAQSIEINVKEWHTYALLWGKDQVRFWVDGILFFCSTLAPKGRLGFVLWMDNQYLRIDPQGAIKYGVLSIPNEQSMEIQHLTLNS